MKQNNNEDIEPVIREYSDMLFRICFLILKNEQDVKDVLQETFIRYLTRKPVFQAEEQRKAWLIKVSQNKCKEFLRFHKRHSYTPLEEVENMVTISDGINYESRETMEILWNLEPKLKSVVILYYLEGYSVKKTAELLSITEAAARKRLQRARQKMQEMHATITGGMTYEAR